MTSRVALYARYSSDLQRDASIEDQLRVCREYAARQGRNPTRRPRADGYAPSAPCQMSHNPASIIGVPSWRAKAKGCLPSGTACHS